VGGSIWCRVYFTVSDDDPDRSHANTFSVNAGTPQCWTNEASFSGDTVDLQMGIGTSGTCDIVLTVTDDWGLSTTRRFFWTF
jgi:hypothetical protein